MATIEINRRNLDSSPAARRLASPAIRSLDTAIENAIRRFAQGALLDAGCGGMPYRRVAAARVTSYDGLDIEARTDGVRYLCSVTSMSPVPSASYDTVLCSEVLEHVSEPQKALTEIARVLRPEGRLLLTVPFLGRLHEEPHDYFRYTEHGIRSLTEQAGMRVESIEPIASVASFLGHQVASLTVGATWHIPVAKWIVLGITAAFITWPATLLDRLLGPIRHKLPLGYVVIAAKPKI